jgi:hypothetical protein
VQAFFLCREKQRGIVLSGQQKQSHRSVRPAKTAPRELDPGQTWRRFTACKNILPKPLTVTGGGVKIVNTGR